MSYRSTYGGCRSGGHDGGEDIGSCTTEPMRKFAAPPTMGYRREEPVDQTSSSGHGASTGNPGVDAREGASDLPPAALGALGILPGFREFDRDQRGILKRNLLQFDGTPSAQKLLD